MRNKSRLAGLLAIVLLTLSTALAFTGTAAQATQGEDHKVWVCHATSGLGELKNGYNLIHVDVASTVQGGKKGENDHYGHSTTDPKDNPKFGVLYDYLNVDPNNLPGKCGEPPAEDIKVTPQVIYTPPTCAAPGSVELVEAEGITWKVKEDGTYKAKANEGYVIDGQSVFGPYDIEQLTGPQCETTTTTQPPGDTTTTTTTPPSTTTPPTTEPPVTTVETTQPPTVSIGTAPVPPSQPSVPPTQPAPVELPETGTNNGLLLLIAAGMLGAGSLLIAATRRKGTIN